MTKINLNWGAKVIYDGLPATVINTCDEILNRTSGGWVVVRIATGDVTVDSTALTQDDKAEWERLERHNEASLRFTGKAAGIGDI